MRELIFYTAPPETPPEYNKSVVLADALEFSIPSDWEESSDEFDDELKPRFQFRGRDEEGRAVMFWGKEVSWEFLARKGLNSFSYSTLVSSLCEAKESHFLCSLNGIDIVFAGDNTAAFGMALTQDGGLSVFSFAADCDLSEIRESSKLKTDIKAILESMKACDEKLKAHLPSPLVPPDWTFESPARSAFLKWGEGPAESFFKSIIYANGEATLESHALYLKEAIALQIPGDWKEYGSIGPLKTFIGIDEGSSVRVDIDIISCTDMTPEKLEAKAADEALLSYCAVTADNIRYLTVLSSSSIESLWFDGEETLYRISAYPGSKAVMQSQKLISDLHRIMCQIRNVYPGEFDQQKENVMMGWYDHSDEEPVSFQDNEFKRMVYAALGRNEDDPVYPSELATIRNLSLRTGNMLFSREKQSPLPYNQPRSLNLADIRWFPNLLSLNITDMDCSGYEAVSNLDALDTLILIRTGMKDCRFLSGLTLTELDLSGNSISDFSPIAEVKGLKHLNISNTGLDSVDLEILRNADLTTLDASDNPITDLGPLSNMSELSNLYIQKTNVTSLDALRNLGELKELNISSLKGEISLVPLYGLEKMKEVYSWGTSISCEDKRKFEDVIEEDIIIDERYRRYPFYIWRRAKNCF